jgi:hypothetical protein
VAAVGLLTVGHIYPTGRGAGDAAANTRRPARKLLARALAKDRKGSRFRNELKKRFGSDPRRILAALGMDQNLLGEIRNEKSRSIMDDERAHEEMAQHGHAGAIDDWDAWDSEPFREALREHGLGDADIESVFSMLPHRQKIEGEDDEAEQEERQRRLEGSERRFAKEDRRDDMEARRREDRDSTQTEDTFPTRNPLPKNRFRGAHDELAGLDELINRVGTSMSTPAAQQLEAKLKKKPDPSVAQDGEAEFLKHFPEAARIGFSR